MFARQLARVFAGIALAMVIGCGPTEKPAPSGLVPFTGTVTLDDKSIGGATVTFVPVGSGGLDAGAETDDSGKFELKSGEGASTGVMPGEYKVIISRYAKPDGTVVKLTAEKSPMQLMTEDNAKETIPPKYSDFMSTTLKATVPAGGGTQDFKLTSK